MAADVTQGSRETFLGFVISAIDRIYNSITESSCHGIDYSVSILEELVVIVNQGCLVYNISYDLLEHLLTALNMLKNVTANDSQQCPPIEKTGNPGRPHFIISKEQLLFYHQHGFKLKKLQSF